MPDRDVSPRPYRLIRYSCAAPVAAVLLLLAAAACDSPTSPDLDLTDTVALAGGSTLAFEDASRLSARRAVIEQVVRDTLATVRPLIAVDRITIVVRAGTSLVIPEIGFGGRADRGTVTLMFDPASAVLDTSLASELFPLLAHELHHVARIRAVGYGNHLLGAMVSEGLADHFAVEVAGTSPPPWSSALGGAQLAEWSERARAQWFDTGYDHDAWFFGNGTIPRWTGYSIGFDMTGRYLAANPGSNAAQLVAEPAGSFTTPPTH
jgi:hypothetical protein